MSIYQRVLLATDLTKVSEQAAQKAGKFTEVCQGKLDLLHVVEPVSPAPYRAVSSLNIEKQHENVSRKQLDELRKTLPENIVNHIEIKLGLPKHALMEVAKTHKNDLIVVNDHGRSGLAYLLGSTANSAVNKATCDVLVFRCRQNKPFNSSMYQHILYATDLSPASLEASDQVQLLSEKLNTKLSIVHVTESLNAIAYSYIGGIDVDQEMADESRKQIAELGRELGLSPENCHIKVGGAKSEIIDLAKKIGADLIVMSSHGHSGLGGLIGSTTNAVLNSAASDILVIRQQA